MRLKYISILFFLFFPFFVSAADTTDGWKFTTNTGQLYISIGVNPRHTSLTTSKRHSARRRRSIRHDFGEGVGIASRCVTDQNGAISDIWFYAPSAKRIYAYDKRFYDALDSYERSCAPICFSCKKTHAREPGHVIKRFCHHSHKYLKLKGGDWSSVAKSFETLSYLEEKIHASSRFRSNRIKKLERIFWKGYIDDHIEAYRAALQQDEKTQPNIRNRFKKENKQPFLQKERARQTAQAVQQNILCCKGNTLNSSSPRVIL